MTRTLRTVVVAALGVLASGMLMAAKQAGTDAHTLQQAIDLIESKGDLPAAVPLLEKAAKSADRPIAARALLYLGQATERSNAGKARSHYERIIREFGDETAIAAQARTRLATLTAPGTTSPAGVSTRHVWTVPKPSQFARAMSPDEQLIAFIGGESALMVHNLGTNETRRLTPAAAGGARESEYFPAFSRDGRQIAYAWQRRGEAPELRTIAVGSTAPVRTLYKNAEVAEIYPYDWGPGDRQVAVQIVRRDRTIQIGLISVPDGALTVLKSMEWRLVGYMAFSPDGLSLAVDLPETDATRNRDVYVIAVDGSRETAVVQRPGMDVLLGWSPTGRHVVFGSDRNGAGGVWAVAVEGSRATGSPVLLKADIPAMSPVRISARGRLYYRARSIPRLKAIMASVDFSTGTVSTPIDVDDTRSHQTHTADFSRDGRLIAYLAQDFSMAGELPVATNRITIRDLVSRQIERQIRPEPELEVMTSLRWAPDGRSLAVAGRNLRGRYGVFVIDATSGTTKTIALSEPGPAGVFAAVWSADSRRLYYLRRSAPGSAEFAVIEHLLATGAEREIYRRNPLSGLEISPDGRLLAAAGSGRSASGNSGKENALVLISTSDGSTRELLPSGTSPLFIDDWLPDSRSVLVKADAEVWRVPVDGSEPGKFGPMRWAFRVHPDGRRIATFDSQSGEPAPEEIWVLENFLPALASRR